MRPKSSKYTRFFLAVILCFFFQPTFIEAQTTFPGYDDLDQFTSEPVDLDREFSEYFGRFFQMNFLVGTQVFTGGTGDTLGAGFLGGVRFVFYFDKFWADELGGMY